MSQNNSQPQTTRGLSRLYQDWFLDYASYVILERAVPTLEDGLKPVQRRILHAMKEMDDGRFSKVANIIGHTMQYHPHGDAAIGDALVHMGQKDLLIETQGNWGDIRTGDRSAAPRYIEARLSPLAREIAFAPEITQWQVSYDGRKKEPVYLPMKFPLLLAQGAEGIAVGLSTKIMPHNFNELIDASIDILNGKKPEIVPDFPAGGLADFSQYNGGQKGGRIRVRAQIEIEDRKTLRIKALPFGVTTGNLIDSIIKANDNEKIKIKRVTDNTAEEVDIHIELPADVSASLTMDGLYAFTDCEVSISPNCCVIVDEKPCFLSVNELLKLSTRNTLELLTKELEIRLQRLQEKWHHQCLEKIFIEQKIYRHIEECQSWQEILQTIKEHLQPFLSQLQRRVTEEDLQKLTEIKIKRISKYNSQKAEQELQALDKEMAETEHHLNNIVSFAINYFKALKKKYGKNKTRQTQITSFETIEATQVVIANQKLYVNRKEGFIGYQLKKEEYVSECSDIDDVIVFRKDGYFKVVKIAQKVFVGKNVLHTTVWTKNDETVYHLIYQDPKGTTYAKRFQVRAITREKEYDLMKGKGSKLLYFATHDKGQTEKVNILLRPDCNARKKEIEFDFGQLAVKSRSAQGNMVTKYPVSRVKTKETIATDETTSLWYDELEGRINQREQGKLLGEFRGEETLLVIYQDGVCQRLAYNSQSQFAPGNVLHIEKYHPETVISVVYFEGEKQHHFVKRFQIEEEPVGKEIKFISEHPQSQLLHVFTDKSPQIALTYQKKRPREEVTEVIHLPEFIDIKGWKARGNRLSSFEVLAIEKVAQGEKPQPVKVEKKSSEQLSLWEE